MWNWKNQGNGEKFYNMSQNWGNPTTCNELHYQYGTVLFACIPTDQVAVTWPYIDTDINTQFNHAWYLIVLLLLFSVLLDFLCLFAFSFLFALFS